METPRWEPRPNAGRAQAETAGRRAGPAVRGGRRLLTGARGCAGRQPAARVLHGCLGTADPEFKAHCPLSLGFPTRPPRALRTPGLAAERGSAAGRALC